MSGAWRMRWPPPRRSASRRTGTRCRRSTAWASRSSGRWSRRAAGQGLYALRGDAARHGLPGAPAPGKHVQRVVLESNVRRGCPGRGPAAGPRGGGRDVGPDETPRRLERRGRAAGRLATLPQRAADRLHPARGPALMRAALAEVRGRFGRSYPLKRAIGRSRSGRSSPRSTRATSRWSGRSLCGGGAGRFGRLVGPRGVRLAVADPAGRARGGAHPGRRDHEATSVRPGGREVHECGKPWREADGDVAEAIDFCELYARP